MAIIGYIIYIIKSSILFSFIGTIVALFVPLAVMMHDKDYGVKFKWDKIVILDYVINAKPFFLSFITSCILAITWKDNDCEWSEYGTNCLDNAPTILWKIIILISITLFTITAIKSISNIYKWQKNSNVSKDTENFKTYHQQKREEYLNSISDEQAIGVWNHTWSEIKKDDYYLNDYFDIFAKYISNTSQDNFYSVSYSFVSNIKHYDYSRPDFQDRVLKLGDNIDDTKVIRRIKPFKDGVIREIIKSYIEDDDPYAHLSILYKSPSYIDDFFDLISKSYAINTLKNDEKLLHACPSVKSQNITDYTFTEGEIKTLESFKKHTESIFATRNFGKREYHDIIDIFWNITFRYTPHISKKVLLVLIIIRAYTRNLLSDDRYISENALTDVLDQDYGYIFIETISVGRSSDPGESLEERRRLLREQTEIEINRMTKNSISIYNRMYTEEINAREINIIVKKLEAFKKTIASSNKVYLSGKSNIEANLHDFIDTLNRVQKALKQ